MERSQSGHAVRWGLKAALFVEEDGACQLPRAEANDVTP